MTHTFSYSINWFLMSSVQLSQSWRPSSVINSHVAGGSFSTIVVKPAISEKNILGDATMNALNYDSPQTPMFNKKGHLHGIPVRCTGIKVKGVVTSVAKTPVNWYFAESPTNSEHWFFIPSNCDITQYYMKNSISMIRRNILVQLMICFNLHVKMELDSQHPGALFHLTRITPSTCSCRPRCVTSMVEIFRAESIPDPKEHDAIKNTGRVSCGDAPNTRLDSL